MSNKRPTLTLGDLFIQIPKLIPKRISKIKTNQLSYIALLIAVFLLGYLLARLQILEKQTGQQETTGQIQQQAPQGKISVDAGHLPAVGNEDAKVEMIEFSDFECPFCKRYFDETFSQIKKDYVDTGKIKLSYRHFPLDFHPAALPSALASECANEQGKFWEYHDLIFTEQEKIAGKTADVIIGQLKTWAQGLGLNTNQFGTCLDNQTYAEKVTQDLNDGKTAGVSGTPSFFINGKLLVGAQPYDAFKAIIDEELK